MTLPKPNRESTPIPQGTQTGTATPSTAPKVPVLLRFPLTFPFECILKAITAIVIPSKMLIVIKIIVECRRFPVTPSWYNPRIKLRYFEGFVLLRSVNINLKFFDKMLIEKNINATSIVIRKYFLFDSIFLTEFQA